MKDTLNLVLRRLKLFEGIMVHKWHMHLPTFDRPRKRTISFRFESWSRNAIALSKLSSFFFQPEKEKFMIHP